MYLFLHNYKYIYRKHQKEEINEFITKFTITAASVKDPLAILSLATTIAKLAQEQFHMSLLAEDGLLNPLLRLLLDLNKASEGTVAVQESVCVAVCHFALNLKTLPG